MEVAVGDERFDRYYRRIRLGLRLMAHGARAQTASDWSGLTLDQLVTLRQRWMPDAEDGFRGPAPTSFLPFFRSSVKTSHAAMFVGIHRLVGLDASSPSLEGGERLCEAYEIYREWEPDAHLEFDYGVLLAMGAITAKDIEFSHCADCRCALLIDKLRIPQYQCPRCRTKSKKVTARRRRVSSH